MGSRSITSEDYSQIYVGMLEGSVKQRLGEPYQTNKVDSHQKVLEYIERVVSNEHVYETRHYMIIIKDGAVVDKKMKYEANDLWDTRDAYDLQTSENYKLNPKAIQ